jgi:hypothetical protein
MIEHTDEDIWVALTARLAAAEAFIPPAPAWRRDRGSVAPTSVRLVAGSAFGRVSTPARGRFSGAVWGVVLLALAIALAGAAILAGLGRPSSTPAIRATGSMSVHRFLQSATLLADGRVLVIGGAQVDNSFGASAELYDPSTGRFSRTGSMSEVRNNPVATRLRDGRVLVLGGPDATAELYDPATGTFTRTGSMAVERGQSAAALLPDGSVLIVGGDPGVPSDFALASAEIYDPGTGTFHATGSMAVKRGHPTVTPLLDGRVLVTGSAGTAPAELYDPSTGRFTTTGSLVVSRGGNQAVRLQDGRVLVAGGNQALTPIAEVFDPGTGHFSTVGLMVMPSLFFNMTALHDGRVLFTGGDATLPFVVEVFDPTTNRFSNVVGRPTTPPFSSATVLLNGDVLIAGGYSDFHVSMTDASLIDGHIAAEAP